MRGAESFMSYEITLNWNITTYEVTATGGHEAPTIITLSTQNVTRHGKVAAYGHILANPYNHSGFITNIPVLLQIIL